MGTIGGPVLQREVDSYGEWVKIFRHNSSNSLFFSNANDWAEAKHTNTGFNEDKYSILSFWKTFLRNGKYTLKLDYPNNNITQIWSQTSNPVDSDGSGGVTGYTAISIATTTQNWGGLERRDSVTSTFLDGSPTSGNWWWAVGVKNSYGGNTTFPGPGTTVTLVELWILNKPA